MRAEPVQLRGIQTKQRIMDAAKRVYERDGRDWFETEEVAKEAKCSIGTIYRYFENRVDLMDAIYPRRDRTELDRFIGELKDLDRYESGGFVGMWMLAEDVDKLIEEYSA